MKGNVCCVRAMKHCQALPVYGMYDCGVVGTSVWAIEMQGQGRLVSGFQGNGLAVCYVRSDFLTFVKMNLANVIRSIRYFRKISMYACE